jgi:alkylhydroperoxidase family enzyme
VPGYAGGRIVVTVVRKPDNRLVHADKIAAVRAAAVGAAGVSDPELRRAAYHGQSVSAPIGPYLDKVRRAAWTITDADISDLRSAGYSEDEIFELTVAAAAGSAGERYDAAIRALKGGG